LNARAVVIDIDGTLVDHSLRIDLADAAAIARARQAGLTVWLATGRLFSAAKPFAQELGLRGPIIVLNGAAVYDIESEKVVDAHPLVRAVALRAYDSLKAKDLHVQLYFGDHLYLDRRNRFSEHYLAISRVEPVMVPDLRELLTGGGASTPGPLKVLGVAPPERVLETIPLLARELGKDAQVFRSQPEFLEITDPTADKGRALEAVARRERIPAQDIAAIGDSDNDIPMFRTSGQSFAVENGTTSAKQAASCIVAAQGSGGVAEAIALLLGERVGG